MIISLGMHCFVFFPIVDLFRSKSTVYIELEMQEQKTPYHRTIPRPRRRYNAPVIADTQAINVNHRQHQPTKIKSIKTQMPDDINQTISVPSVPGTPDLPDYGNLNLAKWSHVATGAYFTKKEYYEMVRLRIESNKKYPPSARYRNMEGRVKVAFEIISQGKVVNVRIEESSGKTILDKAAIEAVKKSSPFPLPPPTLFKLPMKMTIVILFELT